MPADRQPTPVTRDLPPGDPPSAIAGRATAAISLRFYAQRFADGRLGRCDRHDLVAHLLRDAAAEIERLRTDTHDPRQADPAVDTVAECAPDAGQTSARGPWTCFHCGETFTRFAAAALHFGRDDAATPACRLAAHDAGLLGLIRAQQEELDQFRSEETASNREFYALGARHSVALRRAEEAGYAAALRDIEAGKVEPDHAARIIAALSAGRDHSKTTP